MPKLFRSVEERTVTLTPVEEEKVLQLSSSYESISAAVYFDNYDLPCPILVDVKTTTGKISTVVLRKSRHGDVRTEIGVLRALKEYGLPVPEVLSEPFELANGNYGAIYSLLPGENLQKLAMASGVGQDLARDLLIQAVIKLMDATDFIKQHEIAKTLPRMTLVSELEALSTADNPWRNEPVYKAAIEGLQKILADIKTPLVLTNGDYQPGNFLAHSGAITGYLDFESPSFQDPLMGFVKYPIYDLRPLARTDLIKTFSLARGFSEQDFNHRLALGCLKVLKKEIPVTEGDGEAQKYRARILEILEKSLN